MTDVVRAAHNWPTNGHMIEEVARLGYLDGSVLDTTYGEAGGFWKVWTPATLTTNDLFAPADFHYDVRDLPWADNTFDAVVFDPPYKLKGTPALGEQDQRFGTDKKTTRNETLDLLLDGARRCHRVCSRFLLVKCQDMVEGGKVRWQTEKVTQLLAMYGARKVDEFMFMGGGRPQPEGRAQRTAYYRPSALLVFAKGEKDPRP